MLRRISGFFKARAFVLILGTLVCFFFGFLYLDNQSFTTNLEIFQKQIHNRISENDAYVSRVASDFKRESREDFVRKYLEEKQDFVVHVYQGDSLIYWNTNKFPVSNYADIRFPVSGLVRLQNGWYYSAVRKLDGYMFVSTFGIKRSFPLQNDQLNDYFFAPFPQLNATVSLTGDSTNLIVDNEQNPLFHVEIKADKNQLQKRSEWLFLLSILIVLSLYVRAVYYFRSAKIRLLLAALLVALRMVALEGDWFFFMTNTPLFDPGNLALNAFFPNAGETLVSFVCFTAVFFTLGLLLKNRKSRWLNAFLFVIAPIASIGVPAFFKFVITNSTIPIDLHNLLYLNWFTFGFALALAFSGFLLIRFYLLLFRKWGWNWFLLAYYVGFILVVNEYYFRLHGFWIIWIFGLYLATALLHLKGSRNRFSHQLLLLFWTAWGVTFNCITEALKKEHEDRVIFANQLAGDKDLNAEVDFVAAHAKIVEEPYLKRLFSNRKPSFSELKEAMEYRVFNGYWDRYDVDFYFFRTDTVPGRMNGISKSFLDELIEHHGIPSEMDSCFFYIQDYTSQFNYLFRFGLEQDDKQLVLYGTLRSKRIPEKIGFPRILISKQTAVFESLEHYSIAKYFNNRLLTNYGSYEYPLYLNKLYNGPLNHVIFKKQGGFEHLILRKSDSDVMVLTTSLPGWLDYLTSTSMVLVLLSLLYFTALFIYRAIWSDKSLEINMAAKIQLTLIGLIVLSLIGFSIGSSRILSRQYGEYEHDQLREKVRALENEIEIRQANLRTAGRIWNRKDNFDFQIRRWSKLFQTDINIFDVGGRLIGSSRTKIYTIGLLGDRMNAEAYEALKMDKRSEYIHEENIGKLNYLSGYCPVYTHDSHVVGYLNMLQFDKQNAFESELKQFFVAIMNVFMLLLVLSILIAIVVASWITKPLVLLRESFSKVELGKNNQRIEYTSRDEIGYLVSEYNHKLTELADTVARLAQSERESAWREMAKQVAHEIKNPLTPMKLSVQHLQRIFDPNDPKSAEKIQKVTNSLIEQIDTLTSIANAFSNFAKLPQPNMQTVPVNELVQTVVDFFHAEVNAEVRAVQSEQMLFIHADKEMMLRVLNNLITNGIQAAQHTRKPKIRVVVSGTDSGVEIRVRDNGTGIPEAQRERIFEPYFTTKSTGTGLGLAMVKQIIEQHQGHISVEQTNHEGTVILVRLPAAKS